MGSGKSTIAEELVKLQPDYTLIDLDAEIVKTENRSISDIFATDGEDYFRNVESSVLESCLKKSNQIVSTGGGIVLKEQNRELIKNNGITFWLYVSAENIYERIKDDSNRPLINTSNSKEEVLIKINEILEPRFDIYKDCADVIINTDRLKPAEAAKEIIEEVRLLG